MRTRKGIVLAFFTLVSLICTLPAQAGVAPAPAGQTRHFAPTGYTVGGAFLRFYDGYGGVRIFGYPISGEITENGRTVQYFERQRFELHPKHAGTPYEVLLGHLGVELARGKVSLVPIPRSATPAGSRYVSETGHSLGGPFLPFWQANGGVRVLGYPISEPTMLNGLLVQYFERARLEHHPQKASQGYGVELGHLGWEYVRARPEVAALIASGPKPSASPPPGANGSRTLTQHETRIMELINAGRVAAGLAPVALDERLMQFALARSTDMATRNYYGHDTPEGKDYVALLREQKIPFRWSGEVLAKNNYREETVATRVYDGWMASPGHRAIIMDPRYAWAGIGEARDGKGYRFFTVVFIQK